MSRRGGRHSMPRGRHMVLAWPGERSGLGGATVLSTVPAGALPCATAGCATAAVLLARVAAGTEREYALASCRAHAPEMLAEVAEVTATWTC